MSSHNANVLHGYPENQFEAYGKFVLTLTKFQSDLFFHQLDSDTSGSLNDTWLLNMKSTAERSDVLRIVRKQASEPGSSPTKRGQRSRTVICSLLGRLLLRDPAHLWVKSIFFLEVLVMWVSRREMQG